jgi:CheY-like chemotaxis protein
MAWFDATQMEKVLGNLLSNAIKYCRQGDRVTVRVSSADEDAVIEVDDSGPGIGPEHLPRLFDRFYRAAPSDSPIEGTGIGLALARELVLLHGGDLTVDSTLGRGTCFRLHWPARAADGRLSPPVCEEPATGGETVASGESPVRAADSPDDAPLILVADDSADLRRWLRHLLGARYRVAEAHDGQSAWQQMASQPPDLVISDWMMPGMSGIELVEKMRDDDALQGVPVIVLSARGEVSDQIQGLDAGAVAYVRKPFRPEFLQAQIDSLLALRFRLRRVLAGQPAPMLDRPEESVWMRRVRAVVAAGLHDPDFGVEALAEALAIGRTGLFRKLKEECGQSPSTLLREARLARAAELLDERAGTVSEIAYAVGFNSLEGFTRAFANRFGQRPSERLARSRAVGSKPRMQGSSQ